MRRKQAFTLRSVLRINSLSHAMPNNIVFGICLVNILFCFGCNKIKLVDIRERRVCTKFSICLSPFTKKEKGKN